MHGTYRRLNKRRTETIDREHSAEPQFSSEQHNQPASNMQNTPTHKNWQSEYQTDEKLQNEHGRAND